MSSTQMIQIERPVPPTIVAELAPLVKAALAFEVVDLDTDGEALLRVKMLRAGEKRIEEYFEPSRKAAEAAKKEILAARDGLIAPIAQARQIYDRKALDYEAAERVKAEREQRRLQDIARKQEEDRKLADAIEAEESGYTAEAEAILAEPVSVPMVRVAPAIAEVKGVSRRTTWSAEVDDLLKLVRYVAQHEEWVNLLLPNGPALNKLAIAQRDALRIPGVRAVETSVRSTRA